MQIKPIKRRFFIRLVFVWTLVFLAAFAIILYSVNPFEAGTLTLILFYAVLFCLLLGILSFLNILIKIPYWILILIDILIIVDLLIRSFCV